MFYAQASPAARRVSLPKPRKSSEWRPFSGCLAARSVASAGSVIGALYRWLIEQGYLLANPFSNIKARSGSKVRVLDASHVFTLGEWGIDLAIADGLEWFYGRQEQAAQRLRFILDFAYLTGLRASELVGLTLDLSRRTVLMTSGCSSSGREKSQKGGLAAAGAFGT